jgi:hypothetical protein
LNSTVLGAPYDWRLEPSGAPPKTALAPPNQPILSSACPINASFLLLSITFPAGLTSYFSDLKSLIERSVASSEGRSAVLAAHRCSLLLGSSIKFTHSFCAHGIASAIIRLAGGFGGQLSFLLFLRAFFSRLPLQHGVHDHAALPSLLRVIGLDRNVSYARALPCRSILITHIHPYMNHI